MFRINEMMNAAIEYHSFNPKCDRKIIDIQFNYRTVNESQQSRVIGISSTTFLCATALPNFRWHFVIVWPTFVHSSFLFSFHSLSHGFGKSFSFKHVRNFLSRKKRNVSFSLWKLRIRRKLCKMLFVLAGNYLMRENRKFWANLKA